MENETTSNPYTAPTTSPSSTNTDSVDFAPIIRRWERLRLYYNAILVPIVLTTTFVGFPHHASLPGYWVSVVFGGVFANLCFMAGPTIEGYGTYFRFWNSAMTMMLFLAGLGFTALLAIGSIATF
ncbi:hypothetical protein Mal15_01760 [Stieleria maiorica]|uniref:Uncharacterized protein n=1 Tax=Stieleria maiorica TaxID=2795974 RepID=A0A5B9M7Y1_9BACT|nr:hypothetical protein Mal15_01760 [Stieleria maiorica]